MEKHLTNITLPLIVGEPLIITLPNGQQARTYPKDIEKIIVEKDGLLASFHTTNSLYSVFLPFAYLPEELKVGQEIKSGAVVSTPYGTITLDSIDAVYSDSIVVRAGGERYLGEVSLR